MKNNKHSNNTETKSPDLFAYSLGLLFFRRVRKILKVHGYNIRLGLPRRTLDAVVVWGRKKTARRGQAIAMKRKVPLMTIEDSFLRSVLTGRQGEKTIGIIRDHKGIYFDTCKENDLHDLINHSISVSERELESCKEGIELLKERNLSKYNAFELEDPDLPGGFVLVIDQTQGDASIRLGGGDKDSFSKMLSAAVVENPNSKIVVKTHPETSAGKRFGHYKAKKNTGKIQLYDRPTSPWFLLKQAKKVYCVTSQMGMEAIFAGHRPIVFGRPFYAGWGLSDDRHPEEIDKGKRQPEHLFWAVYKKYSLWYNPYFKRREELFSSIRDLSARAENWRLSSKGIAFLGMRLWKRSFLTKYLGQYGSQLRFLSNEKRAISFAKDEAVPIFAWGQHANTIELQKFRSEGGQVVTVEDGFLRSKGLGANLVKPLSLVFDPIGIYYDATRPSQLENLLNKSGELSYSEKLRASTIRNWYIEANCSKYNLKSDLPKINAKDEQKVVLVIGQVEDDASINLGTSVVRTNKDLLWAAKQKFPKAFIIYKPHPDVVLGLRNGAVEAETFRMAVDQTIESGNIIELLKKVDTVCTMTSLTGFEALMHGKEVVCFGAPFYAGWGLTEDVHPTPERRNARPTVEELAYATLVAYPHYWDPVSKLPCSVEVILERFSKGEFGIGSNPVLRIVSKVQGAFSSFAYLWR